MLFRLICQKTKRLGLDWNRVDHTRSSMHRIWRETSVTYSHWDSVHARTIRVGRVVIKLIKNQIYHQYHTISYETACRRVVHAFVSLACECIVVIVILIGNRLYNIIQIRSKQRDVTTRRLSFGAGE